ncbi:hypothetical protein V8E36_003244 [Tilletia maclaganii]
METGHVGNLTVAQNRALMLLWKRFLDACETGPGRHKPPADPARSHNAAARANRHADTGFYSNANGTTARVSHASANGHHHQHTQAHTNPATFGQAGGERAFATRNRTLPEDDDVVADNFNDDDYYHPRRDSSSANFSPADDALLKKYHNITTSGSHIAKDDRIKDQMRGAVEAKEMNLFLQRHGGARLRKVFWEIVKGEHPDTVMLRYLRARRWNVDRALAVIGNIAAFRVENDVFGLVKRGEAELVKTVGGGKVYRNGIAYAWGATDSGLPICYIEVARHFASNQTQEELKQSIILFQEWLGILMPPPVSRKIVCFNMTGFGLRNMDWWCVFFLVKTMEMYWPETLERVYVHRAPWFFKPIWTILRPLLDPVVRDKVRFTTTAAELREYIPSEHLPRKTMAGGMDWHYKYPEPEEGENDIILDNEETSEQLRGAYYEHASNFERSTRALIRTYLQAPQRNIRTFKMNAFGSNTNLSVEEDEPEGADELRAQRDVHATRLRVAWLEWMPFTVAKAKYTRWSVFRPDGTILWTYPQPDGSIDYQIFGGGTSLPVLKQSLALIDEAQRQADQASAEARAASMPMSAGSRSARRGRKRDRNAVQKVLQGQDLEAIESSEPEDSANAPNAQIGLLPPSSSPKELSDTELLASPSPQQDSADETREGGVRQREASDTDDEFFDTSLGAAFSDGGHLTATSPMARLRSTSSAATFGVHRRNRAERTHSHGFDGDAASARAALGAEKAGTGWPSTPQRNGAPARPRRSRGRQASEMSSVFVAEPEEGAPDGERGGAQREAGHVAFAPAPPMPNGGSLDAPYGNIDEEVGRGSASVSHAQHSSSHANSRGGRGGEPPPELHSRLSSLQTQPTDPSSDPSPDGVADNNRSSTGTGTAVDSPYVPARKSMDPGTISFIPGLDGQDPIGQVVYDEDGVPH